ncbi:MAG: ABC transporter ATP-binding protein [Sphaerochaetaceae bacterium]
MDLIRRQLKGSYIFILIVIALLLVKVGTDLFLPRYTSQIVNVGIEQRGIESTIPTTLTKESYNHLSIVEPLIESSYTQQQDVYYLVENPQVDENTFIKIHGTKANAINQIVKENEKLGLVGSTVQRKYIISIGLRMLLISFIGMGSSILVSLFAAKVASSLGKNLRKEIYSKTISFNMEEMQKFSTASLVTRSTNDIQQIQQSSVMILRVVVFAPLMAIGGLFQVLRTNISISWILAISIIAILTVVLLMFSLSMPRFKRMQTLIDTLNRIVRETLTGLPVIRAFNNQKHEIDRFEKGNLDLTKTSLFINRVMSGMMPAMTLIMNFTSIMIVWQGSFQIESGTMQVGDMMAFIQYSMLIIMSFLMMTMLTIILPRAAVSVARIKEVVDTPIKIKELDDKKANLQTKKGFIKFDDVSFAYPDAKAPTLCNISFSVDKGQTVAIIGSTGSGKSTLLNLIPRFYDATSGSISIGQTSIKEMKLEEVRKMIGYVPQQGFLFSGTIESNLQIGERELSEKQIRESTEISDAFNFIDKRKDKIQSTITQGGSNVSGGQRQRLSIARAIAAKPPLLLFDDSFSALDYKTESSVRKKLASSLKETTIFIVAQRVSTIMDADLILVLDEGKLVDQGKHSELLKRCEVYREIAESQLSQKELAQYE